MGLSDILDWEESVFRGLKKSYHYFFVNPQRQERQQRAFSLDLCRRECHALAQIFSACASEIFVTSDTLLLVDRRVCLPATLSLAPSPRENKHLYLVKTLLASIAIAEQLSGPLHGPDILAHPKLAGVIPEKLRVWIERAEESVGETAAFWDFIGAVPPPGPRDLESDSSGTDALDDSLGGSEISTEIDGKGQPIVEVVELSSGAEQEIPIHTFEKVETLEEFNGINRKHDYDDELEEQQEALEALDLRHLVRTKERSRCLYKADVFVEDLSRELHAMPDGNGVPYPEWDYRRKEYRRNWAWVKESSFDGENHSWLSQARTRNQRTVDDLWRKFRSIASESIRHRRQLKGDDFDIDVVVDNEVCRISRDNGVDERIYIQRRKTEFDVATCILFDMSYSIDGWFNGEHLLEVIRDVVYCLGETLNQHATGFSVACFASNTRQECYYQKIKSFDEPWNKAEARIGAVQPRGYTRVGPALRHSTHEFSRVTAKRKLTLLVTDGKPCDYDRYEGTYGIKDVKKAVEEAKAEDIYVHAFAIDPSARNSFPQMFSPGGFHLVRDSKQLVSVMLDTYLRANAS